MPLYPCSARSLQVSVVRNTTPKNWTDLGDEFEGDFRKFCKDVGIHKYHTFNENKATFAERSIRSLKAQIVLYLKEKWMWRYIDELQDFVQTMNNRVNRSIEMAPANVKKKHVLRLIATVKQRKYCKTTAATMEQRPNVGDKVRIASRNMPFRKSYLQQFSNEVFTIDTIHSRMQLPSYTLRDTPNGLIQGKVLRTRNSQSISGCYYLIAAQLVWNSFFTQASQ